jgi:hypothetical protein
MGGVTRRSFSLAYVGVIAHRSNSIQACSPQRRSATKVPAILTKRTRVNVRHNDVLIPISAAAENNAGLALYLQELREKKHYIYFFGPIL